MILMTSSKELCDDPEVVGTVNDSPLTQFDSNVSFVKEMQIVHDPDETSEDLKGICNDLTKVVEVVAGNDEGQLTYSKPDYDLTDDDDKVLDVKIDNSRLFDKEAIVKVNEDVEEVRGYDEISVSISDDHSNNELNEDSHNEVENFEVYVQNNSKVNTKNPNEFIEAEIGRNVVKLLFEENSLGEL